LIASAIVVVVGAERVGAAFDCCGGGKCGVHVVSYPVGVRTSYSTTQTKVNNQTQNYFANRERDKPTDRAQTGFS
jgi:hypothetical protein